MTPESTLLVLDTHVVVWWSTQPELLSRAAARALDRAQRLGVPTIAFWEVSLLVRRKKLDIGRSVADWANRLCAIPRLEPLALTTEIALHADALRMHPDPADRFIVATALQHRARLVTKDKLIRSLELIETLW